MDEQGFQALDKDKARRSFSRAAPDYDAAAVLQHEMGRRMIERLDYIRLEPRLILDIGCGTGVATEALLKRYPKAEVLALDFALPMLARTRKRGRWLRRPRCLCGDLDHLPIASQSVDLVYSNAALQWSQDPAGAIAEMHRVLRPDGLLMFSSFGPDTLKELRHAWSEVDGFEHVHGFLDMPHYGDMLMSAGCADPVMDVERMTLVETPYGIENGEIARPLKNLRFTQSILEALAQASLIGAQLELIAAGWGGMATCVPALKIDAFSFTGKTEF